MMTVTTWTPDAIERAVAAVKRLGIKAACVEIGKSEASVRSMLRDRQIDWRTPGLPPAPDAPHAAASAAVPVLDDDAPRIVIPPAPVVPVGRDLTVSLVGDVHAPEEDRPAWSACVRWHAEVQPDVIVLNEMAEWLSMSAHGGNWGARFEDDVRAARKKLVQIRSVCRDAEIVLLETNHDTRMRRTLAELMPSLAGYLAIPKELKLDDLGIRWIPETQVFRVGRLKVIHGHQLGSGASGRLPENACKRAIQRYGEAGWTVVFFHTHRKGYWMERHDTGVLDAVNIPCLRTLAPDWTAPVPTGWQHGFGIAHVGPSGQTNLFAADIEHGSFKYGGQRYSAA